MMLLKVCRVSSAWIAILFLSHVVVVSAASTNNAKDAAADVEDVRSLIAFKSCITSDPHSVLQDWRSDSANACNFTGIRCTSGGRRVISVDLHSNGLQGSISPAIANLSTLKVLNLYNNLLSGLIPPHLGRLSKLESLHLGTNALHGHIPWQLGNLSSTKFLALFNNFLTGSIPDSLGRLTRLRTLYLYSNSLTGPIPESIGELKELNNLTLSENHLNGTIPTSLGKLTQLKLLYLFNNSLSGPIPESIGELKELKGLALYDNYLTGTIPSSLGKLAQLEVLYLYNNKLHGNIPQQLGQLAFLEKLGLSENNLQGSIPDQLANLSSLEYFDLSTNSLRGTIPGSLMNCTSLTQLYLYFNHLEGTVPASIGRLHKLQVLNLAVNFFRGSIPKSIANLTSLTELNLNFNRMQGNLPPWISTFPSLKYLMLSVNRFYGAIPDSWMNTSSLIELAIDDNSLTGTLPNWLGNLSQLQWLDLANNNFTSEGTNYDQSIPILKALFSCRRLRHLNMSHINLRGILPSNIGSQWPKLEKLSLGGNTIYGSVPSSIANLSSLYELKLGTNLLDGNIPSQMGNMTSIQYIDLSYNKLQGNIPGHMALASKTLAYLYLQHNNLSGTISSSIGELANLRSLSLSMNSFSGKIPAEMSKCLVLEHLDLSVNNLSGEIPPEVTGLQSIHFGFNLSRNALTGRVPDNIAGMQMAQYIDLSNNHLSGNIAIHIAEWLTAVKLNLSFNNFTGNLSEKIGYKLTQLQSMDLSCNFFTGGVPESLYNLSNLYFLNFSYNNFQGYIPCNQGILKNLSKSSFIENPLLCGRCFDLMLCSVPKHHTSNTLSLLKVMLISITSLCGVLLFSLSIWFLLRKWNSSKSTSFLISKLKNPFMKLSMKELERATQCFSAANLIGQGRYGKVYFGTLILGQKVAIKVFLSLNENRAETSFRKECQTLGKLRHRNLIQIITVVYSGDFRAIVMPYMSDGSLHSLLHTKYEGQFRSLCLQMRLHILKELAGALSYLHHDCSPQVIHCDVKPHNVLLDEDMTVKLSDFGIAHFVSQQMEAAVASASSSSYAIKGTVGYVAPEYGITGDVSIKGDVYSFGVVTLEIMTRIEPTDEMFGPHLTLTDWVATVFQTNIEEEKTERIKQILTRGDHSGEVIEIQQEKDLEAIEGVLRVGLICTSRDVVLRPSMKEVESVLSMIYDSNTSLSSTIDIENRLGLPCNNLDEVVRKVETQPPLNKYGKAKIQEVSCSSTS